MLVFDDSVLDQFWTLVPVKEARSNEVAAPSGKERDSHKAHTRTDRTCRRAASTSSRGGEFGGDMGPDV